MQNNMSEGELQQGKAKDGEIKEEKWHKKLDKISQTRLFLGHIIFVSSVYVRWEQKFSYPKKMQFFLLPFNSPPPSNSSFFVFFLKAAISLQTLMKDTDKIDKQTIKNIKTEETNTL